MRACHAHVLMICQLNTCCLSMKKHAELCSKPLTDFSMSIQRELAICVLRLFSWGHFTTVAIANLRVP